jgi:chromosome condensin MukBEF ATPase and DNA-binding subunit MukB
MESGKIKPIIFMLWAGLIHEDENLTEKQVARAVDVRDLKSLADRMNQVMGSDLPVKNEESPNAQFLTYNKMANRLPLMRKMMAGIGPICYMLG